MEKCHPVLSFRSIVGFLSVTSHLPCLVELSHTAPSRLDMICLHTRLRLDVVISMRVPEESGMSATYRHHICSAHSKRRRMHLVRAHYSLYSGGLRDISPSCLARPCRQDLDQIQAKAKTWRVFASGCPEDDFDFQKMVVVIEICLLQLELSTRG